MLQAGLRHKGEKGGGEEAGRQSLEEPPTPCVPVFSPQGSVPAAAPHPSTLLLALQDPSQAGPGCDSQGEASLTPAPNPATSKPERQSHLYVTHTPGNLRGQAWACRCQPRILMTVMKHLLYARLADTEGRRRMRQTGVSLDKLP